MRTIDQILTASSAIIVTDNLLSEISKHSVWVNETQIFTATVAGEYYNLIPDTELQGRALIKIFNLNSGTCYKFSATTFTDPGIEFWKYDFEPAATDTAVQGGEWSGGNISSALGAGTSDIIVSGGAFMAPYNDFAPEEFVPGHTTDSLGINVYTQFGETYATVLAGSFHVIAGTTTSYQITMVNESAAGYILTYNGRIFQRSTTTNFTTSNQYFVQGKNILLPPQTTSGVAGFSYVTIGGVGLVDENTIYVNNTGTVDRVIIESSVGINDVKRVFVLADGKELANTSTGYGYLLQSSWDSNIKDYDDSDRAAIHFYNVPPGEHTFSAWFFNVPDIKFNKIQEDYYTINNLSQNLVLSTVIDSWQPFSDKVIVEVGSPETNTIRRRLNPPIVSNYFVIENNRFFNFFDNNHPATSYDATDILVYANGTLIRSGYDFDYDFANFRIVLKSNLYPNGTYISIVNKKREPGNYYDYIINDNIIRFEPSPFANTSTVKVTSFSNHDNLFMETEIYNWSTSRRYTFVRPIIDDNYIWVYLDGIPLIHTVDFRVESDLRTIQLSFSLPFTASSQVVITSIKRPDIPNKIYGYRIFNDFYNRTSYKRLSKFHTTYLTELLAQDSNIIYINDEGKLSPTNDAKNIPGVVLIDRERIEFFGRTDNLLTNLRRGTGGTSPAQFSEISTRVIDQGILQSIPQSADSIYVFNTVTTTATTYQILAYSTSSGYGIDLYTATNVDGSFIIPGIDQVEVFYGGRPLLKSSRQLYTSITSTDLITVLPEFSINLNSHTVTLNILNGLEAGLTLTVKQKKGRIWTGTESILTSKVRQAKFIREKEAELPDVYFYGGDPRLLDENYVPLTNENDEIIRTE